MRLVHALCLIACVGLCPGRAYGEAASPYRKLFTTPPIEVVDISPAEASPLDPDVSLATALVGPPQPEQKPPQPAHTGFKALVIETASDFKHFPLRTSTWVILGIGGAAAALAIPIDDDLTEDLSGSDTAKDIFVAGKYLGSFYVQLGTATGLYLIGRYALPPAEGEAKTNKVSHLGFDMVRALIVSQALTQATKYIVRRDRPTGDCCAFPSGHASAAFATASVLERHLGYRGAWPTFVIAGYIAMSRLSDNRHFLSDVLFGSALGIASGWTVVGRHGRENFVLLPIPTKGGMMIAGSWRPKSAVNALR